MKRHPRAGIRDRWIPFVLRASIDGETRALLLYLALKMGDQGRFSGQTRSDLAAVFGVTERRIAERFQHAQNAGLLSRAGGGYRGAPARWEVLIPSNVPTERVRISAPNTTGKGAGLAHPLSAPFPTLQTEERVRISAPHDVRVTNGTRQSNDHDRNVGVERDASLLESRDEEVSGQQREARRRPAEPIDLDTQERSDGATHRPTHPSMPSSEPDPHVTHDGNRRGPIPLEVSPGNPPCRVCGKHRLYSPASVARGVCARCAEQSAMAS